MQLENMIKMTQLKDMCSGYLKQKTKRQYKEIRLEPWARERMEPQKLDNIPINTSI